jgi:hypothetical protein
VLVHVLAELKRDEGAEYPLIADVDIELEGIDMVPATVKLLKDKFVDVLIVFCFDEFNDVIDDVFVAIFVVLVAIFVVLVVIFVVFVVIFELIVFNNPVNEELISKYEILETVFCLLFNNPVKDELISK